MKKKQIIFLEPWPEIMIYKIARLFRKKGYETVSIRILENKGVSESFFKKAFDKIISFELSAYKINIKNSGLIIRSLFSKIKNIFKAIIKISRLKPSIIICRATPNWPCALTKILFKKIPMIYFPYDIRSIGLANTKGIKEYQVKNFELKAEKFCFENADGIIHKGHPDELKYIKLGENLKINSPILNFNPYCSEEFFVPLNENKMSKKDKEIHMVYIGSIGSARFEKENYILKCCKSLVDNQIHLHVYMKSNTLPSDKTKNSIAEDFQQLIKSKYFHLHDSLGPKEIVKEISKYDYGLLLVSQPLPKDCPEKLGGYSMGNKNASYLEAGIPCIYDEGVVFIESIMKKYDVGFSLGDIEKISELKKKLKKVNLKQMEKNIIKARNDFSMEENFYKLEKFINKIGKIK